MDAPAGAGPDADEAVLQATETDLIEPFEGFRASVYDDANPNGQRGLPVKGTLTIGFGSIRDWRLVGAPRVTWETPDVDIGTARAFVVDELRQTLWDLRQYCTTPLTQGETVGLLDFTFNLGVGNLNHSALLRKLNQGDILGAADEFEKWDRAGGKVLAGLLRRRKAERDEFLAGQPVP